VERNFAVSIPIKPHLKAYLEDFYPQPFVLTQTNDLGLFLYYILRQKNFRGRRFVMFEGKTETMTILISMNQGFKRGCMLMHNYQIHLFNSYLEDQMLKHAITWVKAAEAAGMSNKEAIYKWIDTYQLDSGSSDWYHRIKKQYFRYRTAKKNGKIGVPVVP
jgi:hypothetical protein